MHVLQKITDAYDKEPDIENLLLDDYFVDITKKYQQAVRDVVALAVQLVYLSQHFLLQLPILILIEQGTLASKHHPSTT